MCVTRASKLIGTVLPRVQSGTGLTGLLSDFYIAGSDSMWYWSKKRRSPRLGASADQRGEDIHGVKCSLIAMRGSM